MEVQTMKALLSREFALIVCVLVFCAIILSGCGGAYLNRAKKLAADGYDIESVKELEVGMTKFPSNVQLKQSFADYQQRAFIIYNERGTSAYGAGNYYQAYNEFRKARKVPRIARPVGETEKSTQKIVAKAAHLLMQHQKLQKKGNIAGALDVACAAMKLCSDCPKVDDVHSDAVTTAKVHNGATGDEAMLQGKWLEAVEAYEPLAKNQIADYPQKYSEAKRKKQGFDEFEKAYKAAASGSNLKAVLLALRAKEVIPEEPAIVPFIQQRKAALYKAQKKVVKKLIRRGRHDQAIAVCKYMQGVLPEYPDVGIALVKAKKSRARQSLRKGQQSQARRKYSAAANYYLKALTDDPQLLTAQKRLDKMTAIWGRNLMRSSSKFMKKNRMGETVLLLAAARRVAPNNPAPVHAQRIALQAMEQKAQLDIVFWDVKNRSYQGNALTAMMGTLQKRIRNQWGNRVNLIDHEQAKELFFNETPKKRTSASSRLAATQPRAKRPDFKINLNVAEIDVRKEEKPMHKSASYTVSRSVPNEQYQILGQELVSLRAARAQVLAEKSRASARSTGSVIGFLGKGLIQGDWSESAGIVAAQDFGQSMAYSGNLNSIDNRIQQIETQMVQQGAMRTEYSTKTARYTSTLHRRIAKAQISLEILNAKTDAVLFRKLFESTISKEDTTSAGQPDANIPSDSLELPSESEMLSYLMNDVAAKAFEQIEAAVRTRGDMILKSAVNAAQQGNFERASELHMIFFFGPYDNATKIESSNSYSYFLRRLEYLTPAKATTDQNTLGFNIDNSPAPKNADGL
jgi:tetratricopeptide (TPR) repeat protein